MVTLNTPKWCWLLVWWHQTRFLEEGKQSVEEGRLCLPPSVHHQLYIHSQSSSSFFTSLLPLGPLRQVVLLPLCDATFYVRFDQSHHLSFKAAAGSFKEREVPLQILQLAAVFWWPQAHVTTHNCAFSTVVGNVNVHLLAQSQSLLGTPCFPETKFKSWMNDFILHSFKTDWITDPMPFQDWILSFKTVVFKL